ncbi:MAG: LPS export ABC transporter periplasmic protein LptC [Deltaproteobacteria bacterium]|nr:LPS export ABC transporter periplasmic protein LptC [Deltaproteobacteria bacterium]
MNHKEIERWYRLRNIKKVSQILVLISLVLLVSTYAGSRFLSEPLELPQPGKGSNSCISIENFVYSSPGPRAWELRASNALVSNEMDKVTLGSPTVIYHGGKGGKVYLTARTGELDRTKCSVSGRGEVIIRYKDFRFITGAISYSDESLRAETALPVFLERGDLSLSGIGLQFSLENEEIVIEQNVRARLYNVKWVEPGQKLPM